jgi:type IV secretory pathway TrbD component
LLLVEFTVVLWLQGISIAESFANRDPVSGTAYLFSLALFALMPLLVNR